MQNTQQFNPMFFPQEKKAKFLNKSSQEFTLFVSVRRRLGIIARVAMIFSRRGLDIHSMQYLPTHDEAKSSLHLSFKGNQEQFKSVLIEIKKLHDVLQVNLIQ